MNMIKIGPELTTSRDWNREKRRMQAEILAGRGPANTGHWSDGPVNAVNKVLGAYQLKQEDDRVKAADQKNNEALAEFLKGMQAKPWMNPDTEQISEAPAGGLDGGMAALGNYADTDIARTLLPQLLMGKTQREYAESREPKFETVESPYGRGGVGQRNTRSGQIVNYQGPQTPKTDSDILEINQLVETLNGIPEGDPRREPYQARLTKITSSQPGVAVNLGGDEQTSKQVLARYQDAYSRDASRQDRLRGLESMASLAGQVESGFGVNTKLEATKALNALGFDVDMSNVASAEQFRTLAMDRVMERISGTKGAISEKEMDAFERASPSLANTPQGNALILKAAIEAERREGLVDQFTQKAVQGNPEMGLFELDRKVSDFRRELAKTPVFTPEEMELFNGTRQAGGAPAYEPDNQQPPRVVRNPETGKLEMQTPPRGYDNPLPRGQGNAFDEYLRP